MTTTQAIREIITLASGTQASIFGTANYAEIDTETVRLIEWIRTQDTTQFDSWIDITTAWKISLAA